MSDREKAIKYARNIMESDGVTGKVDYLIAKYFLKSNHENEQLIIKNERLVEALIDIRNKTIFWARGIDKGRKAERELLRKIYTTAQQAIEENGK